MNRLFHSAAALGMGWSLLGLALLAGCGSPTREIASSAVREGAAAATPEDKAAAEPNPDGSGEPGRANPAAREGETVSSTVGTAAAETQKDAGDAEAGPRAGYAAASQAAGAPHALPAKAEPAVAQDSPPAKAESASAATALAEPAPTAPAASGKRPAASQRPPADRTPSRPGEAEKITFEDLNLGMQADVVYRPFMLTDRAKELDGTRVSLSGYMSGGVATTRNIKEFVLLRNKECKFGPGGQADHLAQVYLKPGQTTDFTSGAIKVEGRLKIEPFEGPDGNTWSIYRLEEAVVR